MVDLLIRNVDGAIHAGLASSAAAHARSVEDEARDVLRDALAHPPTAPAEHIADLALRLFGPAHGADLDLPPRTKDADRLPPDFGGP